MVTGRLNKPLEILTVTTPTIPSLPGCVSWMTAVGHCKGGVLYSLTRTRFPSCRLGVVSAIADSVVGSADNPWSIFAKVAVALVDESATWKAC